MATETTRKSCLTPVWIAALAVLFLGHLANRGLFPSLRTQTAGLGAAALTAAGFPNATFRIDDGRGLIAGLDPADPRSAEARLAVLTALQDRVGVPGILGSITLEALPLSPAPAPATIAESSPPPASADPEQDAISAEEQQVRAAAAEAARAAQAMRAIPRRHADPSTAEPNAAAAATAGAGADLAGAATCARATVRARSNRPINFETGSAELNPQGRAVVQDVARALARCAGVRIEVAGHTDVRGAAAVNQRLSLARAESVRQELVAMGVPADHVIAVGYGESQPLARGAAPRDHARNRRITFTVVSAP